MKKILIVLLIVVAVLSLVSCNGAESELSVYDRVKIAVESHINVYHMYKYDVAGRPEITYFMDEIQTNVYEVTGKVTVQDKYGDTYTGKYDAVVEYNPNKEECSVWSLELGSLYKD